MPNAARAPARSRFTMAYSICVLFLTGCLDRPLCDECKPQTTALFVTRVSTSRVDKIDLVFMKSQRTTGL
jgi:hypothetical protein